MTTVTGTEGAALIVDLLLQATFSSDQGGRGCEFLFGRPDEPASFYGLGASVHFSHVGLAKAALQLRQSGPLYLRSLSIGDLEGRLIDFLQKHYWAMADYVWGPAFEGPYASRLPKALHDHLTLALASSQMLTPIDYVTAYPLVPIQVDKGFDGGTFFLIPAEALSCGLVNTRRSLTPTRFPPMADWDYKFESPTSWLGIRSPAESSAKRMRNAVLGALALLPHESQRYSFSGRHMFGGSVAFHDRITFSPGGRPCTPPLMENLVVGEADVQWLELLAAKLSDRSDGVRRQMRALEYFYRAWPLPQVERFPVLFMALDAVFSNASQHTQAVVDAIGAHMGDGYDVPRLKLLMRMRAAVIHGGAPDVYDSDYYGKYFEKYEMNPIRDFERIVARCLQAVIFEGKLSSQADRRAHLVRRGTRPDT